MDEMNNNTHNTIEGGRRRRRKQTRKSGKSRKSNNALKEWVRFVKKVRAEEKIDSYKKAMSRAKVRADKGEKWRSMKGGDEDEKMDEEGQMGEMYGGDEDEDDPLMGGNEYEGGIVFGGRRRRRSRHRTMRRSRAKSRGRSRRRSSRRY